MLPIFVELEHYYFGEAAASEYELASYLTQQVFSEHSGVKIVAAYIDGKVIACASYTVMYPAPKLSGQMYMKDLFVAASARGRGVGLELMRHLACVALANHCKRLDWTAESTNPLAGRFYQSIGASFIKEKEYYRFEGDALSRFTESLKY